MRPRTALAVLAALLLGAAGCGGSPSANTNPSAGIPQSVADDLAAKSDSIADAWEAGDQCGAAHKADELAHSVERAVSSAEIPAAFQDDLQAAVANLQNSANCSPQEPSGDEEHGKGKKKGHEKDGGISVTTGTTTIGTTDTTSPGDLD